MRSTLTVLALLLTALLSTVSCDRSGSTESVVKTFTLLPWLQNDTGASATLSMSAPSSWVMTQNDKDMVSFRPPDVAENAFLGILSVNLFSCPDSKTGVNGCIQVWVERQMGTDPGALRARRDRRRQSLGHVELRQGRQRGIRALLPGRYRETGGCQFPLGWRDVQIPSYLQEGRGNAGVLKRQIICAAIWRHVGDVTAGRRSEHMPGEPSGAIVRVDFLLALFACHFFKLQESDGLGEVSLLRSNSILASIRPRIRSKLWVGAALARNAARCKFRAARITVQQRLDPSVIIGIAS